MLKSKKLAIMKKFKNLIILIPTTQKYIKIKFYSSWNKIIIILKPLFSKNFTCKIQILFEINNFKVNYFK